MSSCLFHGCPLRQNSHTHTHTHTHTHRAVGCNKRSVKTGSTIEETFPGQANKTSPTFFPLTEIYIGKYHQWVKSTPRRCEETKILVLWSWQWHRFDKQGGREREGSHACCGFSKKICARVPRIRSKYSRDVTVCRECQIYSSIASFSTLRAIKNEVRVCTCFDCKHREFVQFDKPRYYPL